MPQPLVTHIQKYAIHDGAGIRVTVFFKGCPLRCAWCHNPETQSFEAEWMHYPERCIGCGQCAGSCPTGARIRVGTPYSVEDLIKLLLRDRIFYDVSGGGVTLSGGEVMAQDPAYILSLCQALHRRGVRVAIDTCGYAPYTRFAALLPFVDEFLYDIKAMDPDLHTAYTGVDNRLILENLIRLSRDGARIRVRVPILPGVNAQQDEMDRIIAFVRDHVRAQSIHLLPYHRLGQDKNERLGRQAQSFAEPNPDDLQRIAQAWRDACLDNVEIGG